MIVGLFNIYDYEKLNRRRFILCNSMIGALLALALHNNYVVKRNVIKHE